MKRLCQNGPLTYVELNKVLMIIIKMTQTCYFLSLFKELTDSSSIVTPASLAQLAPFVDDQGIIRVSGRLRFSSLCFNAKHPILIPKSTALTRLLIRHYHISFLHGGSKLILSMMHRKFWILSARSVIRQFILSCVQSTRMKSSRSKPFMGDLPAIRVRPHRAFEHVGMDYGGPFIVMESRRRNTKTTKVFVLMYVSEGATFRDSH